MESEGDRTGTAAAMIIGVDPGLSGAVAFVSDAGDLVDVIDMPVTGGRVDGYLLALEIDRHTAGETARAVIEDVHAMPKQGVTSTFKLGRSVGIIDGVLGALCIPTQHVAPSRWKRAMGVTADKGTSRRLAIATWPAAAASFARVKDDGRAEAALIAKWGLDHDR